MYAAGVRLGNWQEEEAMKALTGHSRCAHPSDRKVLLASAARTIAHTAQEAPKDYRSTATQSYGAPLGSVEGKRRINYNKLAPRAQKQLEAFKLKLAEETAAKLQEDSKPHNEYTTASRTEYRVFTEEELKKLPTRKPKLHGPQAPKVAPSSVAVSDIAAEAITVWGSKSHARSYRFTDPGAYEPDVNTAPDISCEAGGIPEDLPDMHTRCLVNLRRRVREAAVRTAKSGSTVPSLRPLTHILVGFDETGARCLTLDALKRAMSYYHTPITESEIGGVCAAIGGEGIGMIDLVKLVTLLRTPMTEDRWQMCECAWNELCGGMNEEGPESASISKDALPYHNGFEDVLEERDGRVTWEEFADGCWSVSCCEPVDELFWKIISPP